MASCTARVLTLNMNIQLPLFWSTWSGSRGQDLATVAHELAWHMGIIIAIVEPQSIDNKVPGHCLPLNCQIYLKTMAYCEGFSTFPPLNCAARPRNYNYFTSTKTNFVEFVSA